MKKCKNAKDYYDKCLSIPLYYGLKIKEQKLHNELYIKNYSKKFPIKIIKYILHLN